MSSENVMDTFDRVFAYSDIPPFLFEPEYKAKEMQWREAV